MYTPKTKTDILDLIERVKKEIFLLSQKIDSLPQGRATVTTSKSGRTRIEGTINGTRHIFNKSEFELASSLIWRRYLEKRREECIHLLSLLEHYDSFFSHWLNASGKYLADNPARAQLIRDRLMHTNGQDFFTRNVPDAFRVSDPCIAPYQEKRTEMTCAGILVRSKSESMIVVVLVENSIPFIYEAPLLLGGKTYYPDFTIVDPITGQTFYYEHFGMMDDPDYSHMAYKKLETYTNHGILPGINLITTFETKDHKLSIPMIQETLRPVLSNFPPVLPSSLQNG